MVTILLEKILTLLTGWLDSFTEHAGNVLAKLNLIEEDTSNLSDIKDNTAETASNTASVITPINNISSNTNSIKTNTDSIKADTTIIKNNINTISTNTGSTSAYCEDIATNTLDTKNKVVTIASDTTQIRTNTNTVLTDLDKVYEALKWSLVDKITTETVEGTNAVSFNTDLTNDLVDLEVGFTESQLGTGNPSPDNIRPIIGYSDIDLIINGNNVSFSFGDTYYEGVIDIVNGTLSITKKGFTIGQKSWGYNSQYGFMNVAVPDIKVPDNTTPLEGLICEVYTTRKASATGSSPINYSIAGINTKDIRILDTNYTDTLSFVSAMGNYKIVYPLAVSQIISLTPTQIATIKGDNTIVTDGDIKATYEESIKHYLDKQ